MRNFVILLVCLVASGCFTSCSDRNGLAVLSDVESLMAERPDSALQILRGIDSTMLESRAVRAKWAVLHSMALDKCYIDLKTDSIIAPAISYYKRHGQPDDRLKAFYYMARICENAGDAAKAMEWCVSAEKFIPRAKDYTAAGRLYTLKSKIYYFIFKERKALENAEYAVELYRKGDSARYYLSGLFDVASSLILCNELDRASVLIDELKGYEATMNPGQMKHYLTIQLLEMISTDHIPEAAEFSDRLMQSEYERSSFPWLDMALSYVYSGQASSARYCIDQWAKKDSTSRIYYRVLMDVCEADGDEAGRLDALEKHRRVLEAELMNEVRRGTGHIEDDMIAADAHKKMVHTRIMVSIIVFVLILIFCVFVYYAYERAKIRKREISFLEEMYATARREKESLEEQLKEHTRDSEEIAQSIDAIDRLLIGEISGISSLATTAAKEVRKLASTQDRAFSYITALYAMHHRDFVTILRKKGLSDFEIGYCCILASGVRVKELDCVVTLRKGYSLNSEIRRKLGLDANASKLATYLRGLS